MRCEQPNKLFILALIILGSVKSALPQESPRTLASRIFEKLTGSLLRLDDPRRTEMESLIGSGNLFEAAGKATQDDRFINITIRNWVAPMVSRSLSNLEELNDAQAMLIGSVRDGRFGEVLYGDFTYMFAPNTPLPYPVQNQTLPLLSREYNNHYLKADEYNINLREYLVRIEPQGRDQDINSTNNMTHNLPSVRPRADVAGILTSRAWAKAHIDGNTNRRAVEYAFQEFLCRPIASLRNTSVTDQFVRRDVERAPGGDANTFRTKCVGCHAGMDALGGAFAYYTFSGEAIQYKLPDFREAGIRLFEPTGVAVKMNRYPGSNLTPPVAPPAGRIHIDNSWVNVWAAQGANSDVGWPETVSGVGVRAFGEMLTKTKAFSNCMAKRAFKEMCRRSATYEETSDIDRLAEAFVNENYDVKRLFQRAVILPQCLKQ